jgi:hypothetical protein
MIIGVLFQRKVKVNFKNKYQKELNTTTKDIAKQKNTIAFEPKDI